MKNPIYEGLIIKCAEWKIDQKHVPRLYEYVLQRNPMLKKADEMIRKGTMNV